MAKYTTEQIRWARKPLYWFSIPADVVIVIATVILSATHRESTGAFLLLLLGFLGQILGSLLTRRRYDSLLTKSEV